MCLQSPSDPCINIDRTLFEIDGHPAFHSARIEAAAAESHEAGREVSVEEFEALVNESGLV